MGKEERGRPRGEVCVTPPRKPLRTRRGGGWVVWGGDALCCAAPSSHDRIAPPPRATQAAPPHSAPLPPLRIRSILHLTIPTYESTTPALRVFHSLLLN